MLAEMCRRPLAFAAAFEPTPFRISTTALLDDSQRVCDIGKRIIHNAAVAARRDQRRQARYVVFSSSWWQ